MDLVLESIDKDKRKSTALAVSSKLLFITMAIGQCIFVVYILGFYVVSALADNFEAWNNVLPEGYVEGNTTGNTFLGAHLFFAAYITLSGLIQLIPTIRSKVPKLHRYNGRLYLFSALIMSISGLYLILSGTGVGGIAQQIAVSMNAIIILACGALALFYAIKRKIPIHQKWALRLFFAVSGVWMFRVGIMFWLLLHGKPVGFDPVTFSGPFLTFLSFLVYVAPIALLEIYFRVKEKGQYRAQVATATGIVILSMVMSVGIFGATMGMWLPRL